MTRKIAFTMIAALLLTVAGCRTTPLVNPSPINASNLTPAQTRTAIFDGLMGRGWIVDSEKGNSMVASINVRGKHEARIAIDYANEQVAINYIDSHNLKYNKGWGGKETIHSNYANWIKLLKQDIQMEIQKLKR